VSGEAEAANCFLNPVGCVFDNISNTLSSSVFGQLRDLVNEAVAHVAESLAVMWVSVPTLSVTASAGGSAPSSTVDFIQRSLWIVTITLLAVSLMIGGARLMLERRGEPFMDVLKGVLTFVFISGGGLFALSLVLGIVDELSKWILDRAVAGGSFENNLGLLLTFSQNSGMGLALGIILGTVAVLVSVTQICLMVLRAAILPVLAGVWPTAAAFSATAAGKAWLQKLTSWIVAFTLYKLAVAVIYATAFRLMSADLFADDQTGLTQALAGVLLMGVAVVALPALVRLIAPMTAAVAGGGGGGAAALGAVAGAAGMLATGAIHSGRSTSTPSAPAASGPSGPTGSSGPSGSSTQPDKSSNTRPAGGSSAPDGGGGATSGRVAAGATSGGGAAAGATSGGAAAGAGGGAAAGAGAAAAGPAAPAVLGAQAALGVAQAVQSQVQQSAEGATGGPTGAQ
jgi:hypothetical protein